MDITKIDTNLASGNANDAEIEWIGSFDKRISLHGIFYDEKASVFRRVPDEVATRTLNPGVVALSKCTAGGRIRFVTDSGFTLTYHEEAGKPFVTDLIGQFAVLFLFTSVISLIIVKIFYQEEK